MDDIVRRVIGGAFTVPIALRAGVFEKDHESDLACEQREAGFSAGQQRGPTITYDGVVVGEYAADPIVERVLLVELKAVNALSEAHRAQQVDYLKAFGPQPGSLLDFGKKRLESKAWPIPAKPLHPRNLRHRLADLR